MAKSKGKEWYQRGKDGWTRAKEEDEAAKERRESQAPWRFRLKPDTSAKITMLDTPNFFVHEHQLKIKGRWGNFFTCIKEMDSCPICEDLENHPGHIVVGTCINHSKWTDREGKVYQHRKQLFVAKGRARQHLANQIKRHKDLKFHVFEMSRGSSNTECSCGEDFEHLGKLTKAKLKKFIPEDQDESWLEPFDYETLFAPKSAEELRKVVGLAPPVGSEEGDGDGGQEGDDDLGLGNDAGNGDGDDISVEDLI